MADSQKKGVARFTLLDKTGVGFHLYEVSLIPPASAFQRASFWDCQKNCSGHLGVDMGRLGSIWSFFFVPHRSEAVRWRPPSSSLLTESAVASTFTKQVREQQQRQTSLSHRAAPLVCHSTLAEVPAGTPRPPGWYTTRLGADH